MVRRPRRSHASITLLLRIVHTGAPERGHGRWAARIWRRLARAATFALTIAAISSPAHAWDSRTHQMITRLAIMALPKSPIGDLLKHNDGQLEVFSVWPDTVLKQ